jgi:hypothetical protein
LAYFSASVQAIGTPVIEIVDAISAIVCETIPLILAVIDGVLATIGALVRAVV